MTDAPLMSLTFELPWPPSVNTYWRHTVVGGKFKKSRASVFLSDAGKRYRTAAMYAMNVARVPRGALKGRLAVRIVAHPPDARVRDLDNICKGVLDALSHGGVIADDGAIDDLHVIRGAVLRDGKLVMRVEEMAHEPEALALPLGMMVPTYERPPF